jgi:hypothetical protein
MSNYLTSWYLYLSEYLKDKISYYFYRNDNINNENIPQEEQDLELFKFKIQEYIVENNLNIDIFKMYKELDIYNPVISKSKNIRFIIHFIENELNYEEKLGQFKKESNTNKIVERIEKTTILTNLLNNFKQVKGFVNKL